jgi:glutathione S-transferase
MDSRRPPILWQIDVSHYSEKARWALELKSVEHERRAPLPGMHIAVALWLTRGRAYTLPVLHLDGRAVGGSGAIIDALEQRYPEPALYPSDQRERAHALQLQDWFDREAGPFTRRLAFYEVGRDREALEEMSAQVAPRLARRLGRLTVPYSRAFTAVRYGAGSARGAEHARARVTAAFDHLEAQLGEEEYLVGGRFTVADLTAAALLFPVVLPPQAPLQATSLPEPYERFRATLAERRGFRWVQEIFERHRHPGASKGAANADRGAAGAVPTTS